MKNAWMVRAYPNGEDRMQEFLDEKIIAVGWPELPDLSGKSLEQLEKELKQGYGLEGVRLGNAKSTVQILVNRMQPGDWILTPYGEDIHLGEVQGDYQYEPADEQDGYPHQRKATWLNCVSRDDLSSDLRNSLKARNTAADLTKHADEIAALARGEKPAKQEAEKPETIPLTYPLRPDFTIQLEIPKDMSKEESQRFSTYIQTLYFTK